MVKYITVYSGTTLENYRKCAYINKKERVLFDKRREPKHQHERFYFDERFNTALLFAIDCVRKTRRTIIEDIPLVMEGNLLEKLLFYDFLDHGKSFPVSRIWLPRQEINWNEFNTFMQPSLIQYFQRLDTKEILGL